MSTEKKNLYEKIQLVSNEVKSISKNMTVGKGAYAYKAVSDIDVTLAVNKAETKYKILSVPIGQKVISSETVKTLSEDGKEKTTFVENIEVTVRFIDLENISDFIDVPILAKGLDNGDKGFGKAATYARKYSLLMVYKIATGEDPDAEKSKQLESKKTISEKKLIVTNYLNNNLKLLQETLTYFNVGQLDDMTEANFELLHKTYTNKKLI